MSTAIFWGLPSHGIVVKRCRECRELILVRCILKPAHVMFFNENETVHAHQPDPMWVFKWAEYVTKQRKQACGVVGFQTDRSRRGRSSGMTMRDMSRTKGVRVRGYDLAFRDCPFVEVDDTGEHY